jgi:glycosidase
MWKIETRMGFDIWGTAITVENSPVQYAFQLTDGGFSSTYASGKFWKGEDGFKYYSVSVVPKFETPDWAKHAVWYQIFPERFRNGDPSNDPGDKPYEHLVKWQAKWFATAEGEAPGDENFYKGAGNVWKRRYGGDVQGLIEALPYLKSLGINAIYLNPMFEADSMHKYDTTDYRHIDEHFGSKGDIEEAWKTETDDPATWTWTKSDRLFLEFVAKAHAMGFKVILDGVFNHVGRSHWAFQDVLKNGKNSKYADWFDIRDWNEPIKYIAWDRGSEPSSNGALPIFKKNPETGLGEGPKNHIFAITKRWLAPDGDPSKGIDGWRLDVPGDIPHPFWIEWRMLVKSTKPDAYISGEIWEWAQPWLNNGDQFDAVMNYRFAVACQDFFVNQAKADTATQFNDRLNQMIYNYPLQTALVQMNLFDSHDTDRFASMFMNPDIVYDASNRIQDNGAGYNPSKPGPTERLKQKQAVALQMCFVGAPMTYYGDENGMWSPDDPSNRQPMVWKDKEPYDDPEVKFDDDLFAFYQRAIAVREHFEALQAGFFRPVKMDDERGIFAFARELNDQRVYVVINRSAQAQSVEIPVKGDSFVDWMSPAQVELATADGRLPTVSLSKEAKKFSAVNGSLTVELKPFGTSVLCSTGF